MKSKAMKSKANDKQVEIPKILIGVPILSWTHEFATSFLEFWSDLMTYSTKGRKFHVGYRFAYRRPVHMAEEELAEFAIDSGCTHLLLMDDDIYDVKAEDLMKLVDADKDVVGGIMFASGFPHAMCAFRRYDTKTPVANMPILKGPARLYEVPPQDRKGLQLVDLIPFGFTLIKTSALKKLPKPWFTCNTQAPTDSWFADSAMSRGLQYYAHFDVLLNHRGVTVYNQPIWVQLGAANAQAKGGASIIELTQEQMQMHEAAMRLKLEEAEKTAKSTGVNKQKFYEKSKKPVATLVGKTEK